MSVLLWIVFAWMAFGTIYGMARTPLVFKVSTDLSLRTGVIAANMLNVLACIVIAIAAVVV